MKIVGLVARIALLAVFVGAGGNRVFGTQQQVMEFVVYGYPDWLRVVTGVIQVIGVLLLWFRETRLIGAVLVLLVIIGAALTYWRYDDALALLYPAGWLVLLMLAVWPCGKSAGLARPEA